ncbi:MAG: glutamate synthase large subunit [Wenzhouxiangellaceae bacterium]
MAQAPDHTSLYHPEFERDSCGFGLIAQMDDEASHWVVATAITSLSRLTHRGAVAADGKSGDGCGLLMKTPVEFLRAVATEAGIELGVRFAVGCVFLSRQQEQAAQAREKLAQYLTDVGLRLAGWRTVPVNPEVCGDEALRTLPLIEHVFVHAPASLAGDELERRLFIARRRCEQALRDTDDTFFIASLSAQTLSYKGLMMPRHLPEFYPDLRDGRLQSSVCLFHQRFSTNTWPQWRLAQPFRVLAHNGEINTIRGNRNWARARAAVFKSPLLPDLREFEPLVSLTGSDSFSLDNMLEILLAGGMDLMLAMRLLIPPAWQTVTTIDPDLRAFYEYYGMHMEAWDGPAGVVLCDGRYAGCVLDRNGLRPARWVELNDRHLVISSEVGVFEYEEAQVKAKGRLGPGEMLMLDTRSGRLMNNRVIDEELRQRAPFREWLREGVSYLDSELVDERTLNEPITGRELSRYEKLFGVTTEERNEVLRVLARLEQEAVGSMGDDTPLAVLSRQQRSLYDYFRQQFAQVTNPPIDPLRERLVMSLETQIGRECNVFEPRPEYARRIVISSPVLSERKFREVLARPAYPHHLISLHYPSDGSLSAALDDICRQAATAVRDGAVIVVLSDRDLDPQRIPVHALLAVGAVHHRLVAEGLRCRCNLLVETATARDPHHFACLLGYGATAVFPYLAYACLYDMRADIDNDGAHRQLGRSYRRGIRKGLFKIMSKMGISTIASYRGAQLFEIIGLADAVVERCFPGTVSRLGGADFDHLQADQQQLAQRAWQLGEGRAQGGLLRYVHGQEYHAYNPDVVRHLLTACRDCDRDSFREYSRLVNSRPAAALRDLLELASDRQPIAVDEVEPVSEIVRRFDSAGMSLGALSPEAHEALAIAMNRLGARSNSGEGGEDPSRYGSERRSKIKQVASGRFGVTPEYLCQAEVLQIKIAQGAKPGEGGQLPGDKVDSLIARLRFAKPGVGLISPPPHHDIYSIEDLAQLIFDLKQVNPQALVSVKLVAAPGVGTIATGVAKAYADLITISGYDGGTGASPLTSIKYAGGPWEMGLVETHQALRANGLRQRVLVQADGGMKTGLDVIKAALLGAESFGFGTAPMIAMGCKYLRICHLNNCATGVATQNKVLRSHHFIGKPEMVMNFFTYVAEEVRELLAQLGYRRLDEVIGRSELLRAGPPQTERQAGLNLQPLLSDGGLERQLPRHCTEIGNPPFDKGELAETMVSEMIDAIRQRSGGIFHYRVANYHRAIGARVAGEIARLHGNYGMAERPLEVHLSGSVGQSFGAWNAGGLHLTLTGDANDYVGKGMAAGRIVIKPPAYASYRARDTAIMGNTCLYGATGGRLFAAGRAGERFAVRNSGAIAVIEGAGDHCCEYMTGGVVCVLGGTGINFGAGMTGGFAYVLDQDRGFVDRYNHALIDIVRITPESMEAYLHHLRSLISDHVGASGSVWGKTILDDFRRYLPHFWVVKPKAADIAGLLDALREAA